MKSILFSTIMILGLACGNYDKGARPSASAQSKLSTQQPCQIQMQGDYLPFSSEALQVIEEETGATVNRIEIRANTSGQDWVGTVISSDSDSPDFGNVIDNWGVISLTPESGHCLASVMRDKEKEFYRIAQSGKGDLYFFDVRETLSDKSPLPQMVLTRVQKQ